METPAALRANYELPASQNEKLATCGSM